MANGNVQFGDVTGSDVTGDVTIQQAGRDLAARDKNVYNIQNLIIYPASRPEEPELHPVAAGIGTNPYKGLSAFHETDAEQFFGREQLTRSLWEKFCQLHAPTPTIRLLAIIGPSGSGKSSIARAGLLHELARNPLPGKKHKARVPVFTPGAHPLEVLATSLAQIAYRDSIPLEKSDEFIRVMQKANDQGIWHGLRRIADALPEIDAAPLIVLIDQFEEIYALCDNAEERQQFLDNLLCAAADRSGHVSIILTLRSDFLGQTQSHPNFNHAITAHEVLIPVMDEAELRQAISKPAQSAGHPLDEATIDLLVEQTMGREGALPLLQFALTKIWDGLAADMAPAETLKQIGGVGGALAGEAQRLFDRLSETDKNIARRAFLRLIQLGEGTRDTRRRINVTEIVAQGENAAHVQAVLGYFADPRARLVTLSANTDDTETAEITHEALLDHWNTLKVWLDASRDDLRFDRRLTEAAQHWEEQDKLEGLLWRPPDLDILRQYYQRAEQDMTPLQILFFETSQQVYEERKRKEVEQERQLRIQVLQNLNASAYNLFLQKQDELKALLDAVKAGKIAKQMDIPAVLKWQLICNLHDILDSIHEKNRLEGHTNSVLTLSFSPDGRLLASGCEDGTIKLWNIIEGRELFTLKGHLKAVHGVSFNPDGTQLASASRDQTIKLWDVAERREVGTLTGHAGVVLSVNFSPDGTQLVSTSEDQTIKLWNVANGQEIRTFEGHRGFVFHARFSPDGTQFASAGEDQTIKLWNIADGLEIRVFKGHTDAVLMIKFSPNGKQLASAGRDQSVKLWNVANGQELHTFKGHKKAVHSVSFSPDGTQLASASGDQTVKLWEITNGQVLHTFLGHSNYVLDVSFSPDGTQLASASGDQSIKVWEVTDGQVLHTFFGHSDYVMDVSFSPDSTLLASGSSDQTIKLWEVAEGREIRTFIKHAGAVSSASFSPDGSQLASTSEDQAIKLWDVANGREIRTLKGHARSVLSVRFSPDSSRLASASEDQTIKLWNMSNEQEIRTLKGHTGPVLSIRFSPDGSQLASASADQTIKLWNVTDGQEIRTLKGHTGPVLSVNFNPDGTQLASSGVDQTIKLWDVTDGQEIRTFKGRSGVVTSVSFSHDGCLLASGSYNGSIRLWDVTRGQTLHTFTAHETTVSSVSFSPDGQLLASGSWDTVVKLWRLDLNELLLQSCLWLYDYLKNNSDVSIDDRNLCDEIFEILLNTYQQQVVTTPAHLNAWNNLGNIFRIQGKLDEAITAFQNQVNVKADHTHARFSLGLAFHAQGKVDNALVAFQECAEILALQGKWAQSIRMYHKVLSMKPDHEDAWNKLGDVLRQQGKFDEARIAYQKQLEVKPDHQEALHKLEDAGKIGRERDVGKIDITVGGDLITGNNTTTIQSPLGVITVVPTGLTGDIVAGNRIIINNIIQQAGKQIQMVTAPYKFLASYDISDRDIFFGRDAVIKELISNISRYKTLVINGRSGSGKTSVINAGLIPRLAENGYYYISFREYSDPLRQLHEHMIQNDLFKAHTEQPPSLTQLLKTVSRQQKQRVVLVFDQFERFFVNVPSVLRQQFIQEIRACLDSDLNAEELNLVFALREDFFGAFVVEFETQIPTFLHQSGLFNLLPLSREEAREAIVQPLKQSPYHIGYDLSFVDEVLLPGLLGENYGGGKIEPAHLQIVCNQLYQTVMERYATKLEAGDAVQIDRVLYEELGGINGILRTYLDDVSDRTAHRDSSSRAALRSMLKLMVNSTGIREFVSLTDLQKGLPDVPSDTIEQHIQYLQDSRIIETRESGEAARYSLAHEVMVEKVQSWFDERELERKRAHEILERGLAEWKTTATLLNEKQITLIRTWLPAGAIGIEAEQFLTASQRRIKFKKQILGIGFFVVAALTFWTLYITQKTNTQAELLQETNIIITFQKNEAEKQRDALLAAVGSPITPDNQLFAILPFYQWLTNPEQGWGPVLIAILGLAPGVTFDWDFSTTRPTPDLLDKPIREVALVFIKFFEGTIDLPTLRARLEEQQEWR